MQRGICTDGDAEQQAAQGQAQAGGERASHLLGASVLNHSYVTRCAASFRAGRRCASSPVPRHHVGLVGAPCPARQSAGGSSNVLMIQDTRRTPALARREALSILADPDFYELMRRSRRIKIKNSGTPISAVSAPTG